MDKENNEGLERGRLPPQKEKIIDFHFLRVSARAGREEKYHPGAIMSQQKKGTAAISQGRKEMGGEGTSSSSLPGDHIALHGRGGDDNDMTRQKGKGSDMEKEFGGEGNRGAVMERKR